MKTIKLSAFLDEIDKNLDTQIYYAKKFDLKYIELRNVGDKPITSYSVQEAKEIIDLLTENGISVSAISSFIGKSDINEDFSDTFEYFKNAVKIAKLIENKYLRIFSFFIPKGEDASFYKDEVMARLEKMTEYAKNAGVTLIHENESGIFGDTAIRCKMLLDTIDSKNFGAIFDPANFVQCGVDPILEAYPLLKDQIEYIHIKDIVKKTNKPTFPGKGDAKIKELLEMLIRDNFTNIISLEPHLFLNESKTKGHIDFENALIALRELLEEI